MSLSETRRKQLDGIVKQMVSNKESDANIQAVVNDFSQKYQNESQPVQTEQPKVDTYGALFPAKTGENPLIAGLKATGNVIPSAFNLGKGIASAAIHPIKTLQGIGSVAVGGVEKLIPGEQKQEESFNQFAGFLKERYGSLENLQRTATNDPFGFGSDILGLVTGGATLAGKTGLVTKAVSKVGGVITNPVTKVVEKTADLTKGATKFGVSQATGLNPETITELIKNPQAFKEANTVGRAEVANAVADSLDTRLNELSGLGKEYQVIRETPQAVTIPENTISKVLDKYGIKVDGEGKILKNSESRPISVGDKVAIEDFIDTYGKERVLSSNGFLNTREALSKLAKYDSAKTDISTAVSRDLRSAYDEIGKSQIKGLKELDTQYAPERELLGKLKKDIFDAKGELKDNAISKIANMTGKGKENLLERMKQIVPDIEQRVKLVKAVEDIERSSGLKVGTYARAGSAIFGLSTGNIPLLIASILAQPELAVPILKGAGYIGQKAAPILNTLKTIANDVNNFKLPAPILDYAKDPKVGLSVQDITKGISSAEKGTLRDFTDAINGAYKPDQKTLAKLKRDAQEIADKYNFTSATKGDKALANQIGEYLDRVGFDKKIKK